MDFTGCKYIIVGSGLFGSVMAERIANDLGERVVVIEKRNHFGGNCFSEIDPDTGIEFHKYGTHIFHTSNRRVWEYIKKFTDFNPYVHQVLTVYKNKVFRLPVNLETINSFYGINLKPFEVQKFLKQEIDNENIIYQNNFEEKAISVIGRPLYEAFLKGYTQKQWQKKPSELPISILDRLPFRTDYNENYFHDKWQGIPEIGFGEVFKKLLCSENIDLHLDTDYFSIRHLIPSDSILIYTGTIDQYFNYCFGRLEWRSLKFEKETVGVKDYQGTSVMNYAELEIPFTRIHEPRHLHPERDYPNDKSLIIKEYPETDMNEPFYPINDDKNQRLYNQYLELSQKTHNVIFGGRLGNYRYYDMHDVIESGLNFYDIIKRRL